MKEIQTILSVVQAVMQRLATLVISAIAVVLLVATVCAALGVWPWLSFTASYGEATYENAGMFAQLGLTALFVALAFYLPMNARVMRLETSHRRFQIGMQDVARAYATAHAADRQDKFHMTSEFDAVRERINFLRSHPDLSSLEPDVLEAAAQMSYISKELAEVYSEEKVTRARAFLQQRQEEVKQFEERYDRARAASSELSRWLQEVELEESVAAAQLERIREDLNEVLPGIGLEVTLAEDEASEEMRDITPDEAEEDETSPNVLKISPKAAE